MTNALPESTQRRKYDKNFKSDAVNRVLRTGKSCTEVGRELGINGKLIARWRKKYIECADRATVDCEHLKPGALAEELRKTRRELVDMREQRDILKKALGIFSRHSCSAGKS